MSVCKHGYWHVSVGPNPALFIFYSIHKHRPTSASFTITIFKQSELIWHFSLGITSHFFALHVTSPPLSLNRLFKTKATQEHKVQMYSHSSTTPHKNYFDHKRHHHWSHSHPLCPCDVQPTKREHRYILKLKEDRKLRPDRLFGVCPAK